MKSNETPSMAKAAMLAGDLLKRVALTDGIGAESVVARVTPSSVDVTVFWPDEDDEEEERL